MPRATCPGREAVTGCGGDAASGAGRRTGYSTQMPLSRLGDHDLMVKAVEANTDQKWVVLYVEVLVEGADTDA
jgi:hypothetical protein